MQKCEGKLKIGSPPTHVIRVGLKSKQRIAAGRVLFVSIGISRLRLPIL